VKKRREMGKWEGYKMGKEHFKYSIVKKKKTLKA